MRTSRRIAKVGAAVAIVVGLAWYAITPYNAVHNLDLAVRAGDTAYLSAHIDWPSVRRGIIHDLDARISDVAALRSAGQAGDPSWELMRAMAARSSGAALAEEAVSPETLAIIESPEGMALRPSVTSSFFTGPASFLVNMVSPSGHRSAVRLTLERGQWTVTRAWLPLDLLVARHGGLRLEEAPGVHASADDSAASERRPD